jgi:hypothetical protein
MCKTFLGAVMNVEMPYFRHTGRARLEKAVNSLIGIVEGIAIDGVINSMEVGFVRSWLHENIELRNSHPFTELIPVVEAAVADGILTEEERLNILWLCSRLQSTEFFDQTTADMQRLHGLLAGIVSDQIISERELRGLSEWLSDHEELKTRWPFDEIESIVTAVLRDGKIDDNEHRMLRNFFSEFVAITDNKTIVSPLLAGGGTIVGLCAVCPEIHFSGKRFVFTGASEKSSRDEFAALIQRHGGLMSESVSKKTDYLIIGADGNPCWAYSCYGRKVEMAVSLRKKGVPIHLIHENDFWDAIADQPS